MAQITFKYVDQWELISGWCWVEYNVFFWKIKCHRPEQSNSWENVLRFLATSKHYIELLKMLISNLTVNAGKEDVLIKMSAKWKGESFLITCSVELKVLKECIGWSPELKCLNLMLLQKEMTRNLTWWQT